MIDTVNVMHLDSVLNKIQTNFNCIKHENNYCVLGRLFKIQKNGTFLFGIFFSI